MKSAAAHAKRVLARCGGASADELIRGFRLQVRVRDDMRLVEMVGGSMILPGGRVRGTRRGRPVLFIDPALEGKERDRQVLWNLCWHILDDERPTGRARRRERTRWAIRRARDRYGFPVADLVIELYREVLRRAA